MLVTLETIIQLSLDPFTQLLRHRGLWGIRYAVTQTRTHEIRAGSARVKYPLLDLASGSHQAWCARGDARDREGIVFRRTANLTVSSA